MKLALTVLRSSGPCKGRERREFCTLCRRGVKCHFTYDVASDYGGDAVWELSNLITDKWDQVNIRVPSWNVEVILLESSRGFRWRTSQSIFREEMLSQEDNRCFRNYTFLSDEGTALLKMLSLVQSEQCWVELGDPAGYSYCSKGWTEFVAVHKEPACLSLPA